MDLTARLERRIDERTGSRVHLLRVENEGEQVIVHGYTDSYYVLQLAVAAVRDALENSLSDGRRRWELDVRVGAAEPGVGRSSADMTAGRPARSLAHSA